MGRAGRSRLWAPVLALGALLLAVPPAGAVVTIGSDLETAPGNADPCDPDAGCTIANAVLPSGSLTSPLDGVVVRWQVRAQTTAGIPVDLRLRVIREGFGAEFRALNSSTTRTIPATGLGTFSFPTRQAIGSGDRIGLDVEPPSDELLIIATAVPGPVFDRWQPPLGNVFIPPTAGSNAGEVTVNADIEADADDDGFGDETQDDCPGAAGIRRGCETVPPETTIVNGPKPKIKTRKRRKRVRFEFVSSEAGSDFRCEVDNGYGEGCRSPFRERFRRGRHRFEVQAIDAAGNADPTPATLEFKLKRQHKR